MATATLPIFLLFLIFSASTMNFVAGEKTWCVAKPSVDEKALQENINYACTNVDCNKLKTDCFTSQDNLLSRASVAMNLYYQIKGRNDWNCNFTNSGIITITDPSYGSCVYE